MYINNYNHNNIHNILKFFYTFFADKLVWFIFLISMLVIKKSTLELRSNTQFLINCTCTLHGKKCMSFATMLVRYRDRYYCIYVSNFTVLNGAIPPEEL